MAAENTQDIEVENIDESVWVPQGSEVVPAALLLNGHARVEGKRFVSSEASLMDRLLYNGRIEPDHHETALRLIRLFRAGTSRQNYATMRIFSTTRGYDNSNYCPMTNFIRVTRALKPGQFYWIRVLCGLYACEYMEASRNADIIKEALEAVDKNLHSLPPTDDNDEN